MTSGFVESATLNPSSPYICRFKPWMILSCFSGSVKPFWWAHSACQRSSFCLGLEKPQNKSATDFDIKDVKSGKVQVRLKNIDIRNGTNFFRCEIVGFSKASEFVDLMVAYFILISLNYCEILYNVSGQYFWILSLVFSVFVEFWRYPTFFSYKEKNADITPSFRRYLTFFSL